MSFERIDPSVECVDRSVKIIKTFVCHADLFIKFCDNLLTKSKNVLSTAGFSNNMIWIM
jgi:hypothetical protein